MRVCEKEKEAERGRERERDPALLAKDRDIKIKQSSQLVNSNTVTSSAHLGPVVVVNGGSRQTSSL